MVHKLPTSSRVSALGGHEVGLSENSAALKDKELRLRSPPPIIGSDARLPDFHPLELLLAVFGGWANRQQTDAIEYLFEENQVLEEQLGGRRLRLSNDQHRRLAAKGKRLGRALLGRIATIVTPDTILRALESSR
ncbi:MAG: hypothetical protein AAF628_26920 [Planctomycetota bacterium]